MFLFTDFLRFTKNSDQTTKFKGKGKGKLIESNDFNKEKLKISEDFRDSCFPLFIQSLTNFDEFKGDLPENKDEFER